MHAYRNHTRRRTRTLAHLALLWPAPLLLACGGSTPRAEAGAVDQSGRVISVEVETVHATTFTEFVRIVGAVSANLDVILAAEETGVIRQILADKGASLRAGQPIARIDDAVLRAQLARAVAQAELAEETWQRRRRLWEDEQVGTEMSYLDAKFNARAAAAGVSELRARLERTVVRAPMAGVLDARMVEVGTMVAPGTPIARVVDNATVRITGGVPERYAADIARGAELRVSFDGLGAVEHTGRVQYVGATLNEQTRTFPIEVILPNRGRVLRPGMVANLQVARHTTGGTILVPQNAVLRRDDGHVVYVANDSSGEWLAEVRDVITGATEAGRVVIQHGLSAGERIITTGQQQVSSGDRLRVVQ